MAYNLGVDLGTTYTAAAVVRADGRASVVQLTADSQTMPSVISLRDDGEILVGEVAERRAVTHPARTVREFKRRFGDSAPVVIGGRPFGVDALTGHLLVDVLRRVTAVEGEAPERVALAHPASWGPYRLDLLRAAGQLAGLADVSLVPEPIAAALANRDRVPDGALVAVYDLGGGTFDAAVVRGGRLAEVVGTPEGVERLGGVDFDQAVMAHVDASLGGAVFALDASDPEARASLARLREDCRTAKEALSTDTEAEIPVMLPTVRTSVRLTRAEFEALIRPRLADSLAVLDRVVASTGEGWGAIDRVLLVGGSSRIPLVGQLVQEHTGRPVVSATNPAFAIAIGTAMTTPVSPVVPAVPPPPPVAPPVAAAPVGAGLGASGVGRGSVSEVSHPTPRRRTGLIAGLVAVAVLGIGGLALALGGGGGDDEGRAATTVETNGTDETDETDGESPTTTAGETDETTPATTGPASSPAETTVAPSDGRPVPAPIASEGGGARSALTACTTPPELDGAQRITATANTLFALVDDRVWAFTVANDGGCVVTLGTSFFPDGVVITGILPEDIGAGVGVLAVAGSFGGVLVDLATGTSSSCADLLEHVAVAPSGGGALTWEGTGPAIRLELTPTTCEVVEGGSDSTELEFASVGVPGFVVTQQGQAAPVITRLDGERVEWTHGGSLSCPIVPYRQIDGVVPCGPVTCVVDSRADRLHLIGGTGDDESASNLSGLTGLPAPVGAATAAAGPEAGWVVVTINHGGATYSYLFRVAAA